MVKPSESIDETAHYANGKIKFTGFRLDGELHGAWEWYRTDGTLMRAGQFDQGKQIGVWRTFDRSGVVVKETDLTGVRERGLDWTDSYPHTR